MFVSDYPFLVENLKNNDKSNGEEKKMKELDLPILLRAYN